MKKQSVLWVVEALCEGEWDKLYFGYHREMARSYARAWKKRWGAGVRVVKYIREA